MSSDDLVKWVTAFGAMVAAVTGIWSVWWQVRGKHDRFLVGLDAVMPAVERATMMHVVNLSDHAIRLKDWGFIEADWRLLSLPLESETLLLHPDEVEARGSSKLVERNATLEMGYIRKDDPVGAYAICVTQKRPRLYFRSEVPLWHRLRVRMRLLLRPNYFSWQDKGVTDEVSQIGK